MLIGYSRVSTQDQSPQLQIDALEAVGCERIFTETASGARSDRKTLGARSDRKTLNEAMEFARKGDTFVVWKLDRLARSMKQLINTIESLDERGIGFNSITESIDTNTSGGRLVFHIFGSLAEFERSIIRERTIAGIQAAAARGRKGGRPPALKESDHSAAKALLNDPNIPIKEIAERLGVSTSTLYQHFPGGRSGLEELR